MGEDQPPGDGQLQPAAVGAQTAALPEAVKDVRQILRRDAFLCVGHGHLDSTLDLFSRYGDPTAWSGVAQSTGEQVAHDLAHTLRVSVHGQRIRCQLQVHPLFSILGRRIECDDPAQQIGQVGGLALQQQSVRFSLGQHAQIFDQA